MEEGDSSANVTNDILYPVIIPIIQYFLIYTL